MSVDRTNRIDDGSGTWFAAGWIVKSDSFWLPEGTASEDPAKKSGSSGSQLLWSKVAAHIVNVSSAGPAARVVNGIDRIGPDAERSVKATTT